MKYILLFLLLTGCEMQVSINSRPAVEKHTALNGSSFIFTWITNWRSVRSPNDVFQCWQRWDIEYVQYKGNKNILSVTAWGQGDVDGVVVGVVPYTYRYTNGVLKSITIDVEPTNGGDYRIFHSDNGWGLGKEMIKAGYDRLKQEDN